MSLPPTMRSPGGLDCAGRSWERCRRPRTARSTSSIADGVTARAFTCPHPGAAAWRILSLLDGLALQIVAHGTTISRAEVVAWATGVAEMELGLDAGTLGAA